MRPDVLLSLIHELYQTVITQRERIAHLEAELLAAKEPTPS